MEVEGRIWIKEQGKNFIGHGKVELLERISKSGSISKAAKEMKMSYKAAWDCIDAMNKLSLEPIVISALGGRNGGGTKVTQKGLEMIKAFRQMENIYEELLKMFEKDLQAWNNLKIEEAFNLQNLLQTTRRPMIKTSARNQLFGEVSHIKEGAVNAEVTLKIGEGLNIVSTITMHSLKEMDLKIGTSCYALIKANWIIVFSDEPKGSMRNTLEGKITNLTKGEVNTEVEIKYKDTALSAIITEESAKSLGLSLGKKVWFGFKASHVILGI
ncbi:molybdenum-dependent transcriptional regulator [Helicobacter burdigaliensis]|uniref:molybdenum-dependent transcriptional regulator n=1 Tax=Helicobacter burdigaliensis TaxID=2315334 RepID=UPI000EF73E5B|nr:molybdenum-dependent transcriptional regulator [Helicobacter burdigaliensis]